MRRSGARAPRGFVLVASLWLVAGLGLLAAYIDGLAAENVERAVTTRATLTAKLDLLSSEATVLYLIASNRNNHRGFILDEQQRFASLYPEELPTTGDGELWVTDDVYRGSGNSLFSIQDEVGLVSVNTPRTTHFAALMRLAGVSRQNRDILASRIGDYVDGNSALALNGAEKFDYERAGLTQPPNWLMTTPEEARLVFGFDDIISPRQWRRISHLMTTRPQVGFNFNTMRPELLEALLDLERQGLANLLEVRRNVPITSQRQLRELTGRALAIEEESIVTMPGRAFRLTLWQSGALHRQFIGVRLTPYGEFAPWRIDYRYSVQTPRDVSTVPRKTETALL